MDLKFQLFELTDNSRVCDTADHTLVLDHFIGYTGPRLLTHAQIFVNRSSLAFYKTPTPTTITPFT